MSQTLTHVFEKNSGSGEDVDIFILEPREESAPADRDRLVIQKLKKPPQKGNSVSQLCSSLYYVKEDAPIDRIVEELAALKNVFALGVVNSYGEAKGVIIRRELFDLVGRSYGKSFIEGKTALNVMKYVKSFSPESNVFSLHQALEEEMKDQLISYFLIKDNFHRFAGVFSTKDMMLFYSTVVNNEMKLVQEIQKNIVEPQTVYRISGGDRLLGLNKPAKEAGGDYYHIRQLDENKLFYCVADVSGKGYPASLITAVIGTVMESTTFSAGLTGSLKKLNRFLQSKFGEMGIFATGMFVMYDIPSGQMEICDCGHQLFYLIRDKQCRKIKVESNPPLGLIADLTPASQKIATRRHDKFLIMTDGILEQLNESGSPYPLVRLARLVNQSLPDEAGTNVLQDMEDYRGFAPQHDDVTLLIHQR